MPNLKYTPRPRGGNRKGLNAEQSARRRLMQYYNYEARRIQDPESIKKWQQDTLENHRKLRIYMLKHYSNSERPFCACCGENHIDFLCIDHIHGGGNEQRRKEPNTRSGGGLAHWIIRNNFPPIFQVLCYNCNMAKAFCKICPHKKEAEELY